SMNGEVHREFRALVRDAFSPAAIARWEVSLIDPLMHRLIDRFAAHGHADLVLDYTSHFPFHVIRVLLGFPEDVHDGFVGLAYLEGSQDGHHGQGPAGRRPFRHSSSPISMRPGESGPTICSAPWCKRRSTASG